MPTTATAIPTLNINQPVITNRQEQMAYLLKFAFWNPGWTSSQIENSLLSMRKLRAKFTQDIPDFPQALQEVLNNAVKRYNVDWKATVTYRMHEDQLTYTLIIAITDGANIPVINLDSIVVRDGEIMLKSDLERTYAE